MSEVLNRRNEMNTPCFLLICWHIPSPRPLRHQTSRGTSIAPQLSRTAASTVAGRCAMLVGRMEVARGSRPSRAFLRTPHADTHGIVGMLQHQVCRHGLKAVLAPVVVPAKVSVKFP